MASTKSTSDVDGMNSPTSFSPDLERAPYSPGLSTGGSNVPFTRTLTYADDVEFSRRANTRIGRRLSIDSLNGSLRSRGVSPGVVLPPTFRTLSIEISETVERGHRLGSKEQVQRKHKTTTNASDAHDRIASLDYHTVPVNVLLTRLSASPVSGLSSEQVARKTKEIGRNVLSPPESQWMRNTLLYMFGNFGSVLFIASVLVFISWKPLGEPPQVSNLALGIVLAAVWVIQAVFSWWQDFSSGRVMSSITTMLPNAVSVLRDGTITEIDGKDIVPGDIIQLSMGHKLPADMRFIEVSSDVRFDRSILTGETAPLLGSVDMTDENYLESANVGMAGTHCVSGTAKGVVVETGDRTVFGQIAKLTAGPKPGMTTLQKEILRFVLLIVALMLTMIIVVIIVWATWLRHDHPDWISVPVLIVDCVSVAVAFIPEGLPIAVTASLTITANIMKRNKILCKSLKTVETLGAVNIICSDKTGTLTKNEMTVTDYMLGKNCSPASEAPAYHATDKALQQLASLSALNNAAEFDPTTNNLPLEQRKVNGDATDSAIIRFAESMTPVAALRQTTHSVFKIAFNSKNKFAIVVTRDGKAGDSADLDELTIKGAPDILLDRCTSYLTADNEIARLTEPDRVEIERVKNEWSSKGKRVILLAKKTLVGVTSNATSSPREYERDVMDAAVSGLTLVGLVGIVDPPRAEIPEVVRTLRTAGIRIFMVTGDFKLTAQAIAEQCGILTRPASAVDDVSALTQSRKSTSPSEQAPSSNVNEKIGDDASLPKAIVVSGPEIPHLTKESWDLLVSYDEIVFARTTPDHKLRIVKELQAREFVVGMTGDGVNDAPSLKAADVGIAMGSGSDIAMEAADMVLLDSFAAIVEAVRYGRVVYDNLKKTICYLLPAGSFSEFWPVMTSVIFGMPQILSSFLMIIICCFTDCAAATAIAYEEPEADVLLRPPRDIKKDRLVNWKLVVQAYGFIGVIETVLSFTVSYWYAQRRGVPFSSLWFGFGRVPNGVSPEFYSQTLNEASSIYFINLVVMQWFCLLAIRTRRLSILQHALWKNWRLLPAIIFSLVIAIIFLYIPAFHTNLGTSRVPAEFFFLPMAFGMGILVLDEARKYIVRIRPKGFVAKCAW